MMILISINILTMVLDLMRVGVFVVDGSRFGKNVIVIFRVERSSSVMMMMMMMMTMIMMMVNCFCGMVVRRKAFSLISSWDDCQRSSPLRISDTLRAGFITY